MYRQSAFTFHSIPRRLATKWQPGWEMATKASIKRQPTDESVRKALRDSLAGSGKEWIAIKADRGAGTLMLRAKNGVGRWYFRYIGPDGKRITLPIGRYVERAEAGAFTLSEATAKARALAAMTQDPTTADIRGNRERQARDDMRAKAAEKEAEAAAKRSEALRTQFSLEKLCAAYADCLEARGKTSAASVRSTLALHVTAAHPEIAAKPAQAVTKAEGALIVRRLIEDGKPRTAGLVRSYLHAAYRLAQTAEGDPTAPAALIPFGIDVNPMAGVRAVATDGRDRVLTDDELRAFLKRIKQNGTPPGELVLMALMLGGQRPAQLARSTVADFDAEAGTLTLHDPKGRRSKPRRHVLPLQSATLDRIVALAARAQAQGASGRTAAGRQQPVLLFSNDGTRPADFNKASAIVREISSQMVKAKEASKPFQMRDLRRTVETTLSAMGVSKDTRAQLLSHGLSGVQSQRYDWHDYLPEKRAVLIAWNARLDGIEAGTHNGKVVPIHRVTA